MQALYAFELGGGDAPHILDTLIRPKLTKDAAARTFAERLFRHTLDHAEEADKLISQHADNWDLTRIASNLPSFMLHGLQTLERRPTP